MKSWFAEKSAHGRRSSTLSRDCQCFQAILFVALWTNLSGISSLTLRRIVDCLYDGRRLEASLFFVDARDGTSRRCQVVARPSNAESAQKCQLVTPGFAAAVSTSGTHLVTKIPHLSAHRYPRNTCRILKSLCQDAFTNFRQYIPMAQQQDALYLSSSLHDFPDHSWADSMQNCKNFAQSSAISNDLGWTEDRFQPPKSHQIVDSLPHQIKSSLFSSLFRTCESLTSRKR